MSALHTDTALVHPSLGFGLGLRPVHYPDVIAGAAKVDWFEILSENYMIPGGRPLHNLDLVREHYPLVMHGVSLSIGSTDPLNMEYLTNLKLLAERVQPMWLSDHLCWTGAHATNLHDLMPLPYTEEAVEHVARRVEQVQDFLGRRILLENVSSYVTYTHSVMSEWEFLTAVVNRADCLLLLDINNIYVSGKNHHFDPLDYLQTIPAERVQQIHLAGHSDLGTHIIDTHDAPVIDPVWTLYGEAIRRFGPISTMIERDDNIPPLNELVAELDRARQLTNTVLATSPHVAHA